MRIVNSDQEIYRGILNEARVYLDGILVRAAEGIKVRTGELIEKRLKATSEYINLATGGNLQGELGVVNSAEAFDEILRIIKDGVSFVPKQSKIIGDLIEGGATLRAFKEDYSDILNTSSAKFVSTHGFTVPWLDWLLFQGGQTPVGVEFSFYLGSAQRPISASRTHQGIMAKRKSVSPWTVPGNNSRESNFITRSMDNIEIELETVVSEEIARQI